MAVNDYVLVQGMRDTRSTLEGWRREPGQLLPRIFLGAFAIAYVVGVTIFSLSTQIYILGNAGATLASQAGISPGELVLTVAPHALIELTAVFLPLAAWIIFSRRGEWNRLLAATFVTVAIAIPTRGLGAARGLPVAAGAARGLARLRLTIRGR